MSVPPVVPATSNLNTIPSDELVEALKNLQLQNQALLQENRTLKATHVPQHKTKAAVLEEAPDSNSEGILKSKDIQRLQWAGQSLIVFCYVWWDRLAVFGHNRGQCKEELDLLHAQLSEWNALSKEQQSRIEDFKKKKVQTDTRVHFLRIIEALYEEVPEIYHDLIKVFANSNNCSTDPRCLSLLGYDSTRKRYTQCPNLLFPEGKAFKNGPALFWSSALVKILSHVLLGASSLTTSKKTRSTNTVLWGKSAITPGAIVFAAVVARFLLTSDKFMETGESTSSLYAADCRFYIKTIQATLNLTSTKKMLEYFDRNLFLPKRNLRGLLTLRAPTTTLGTSIASNYVDVSSDDNNIDNDNNIHNSNNIGDDNDNDNDNDEEIMVNGTPPNTPIESNTVVAKTARLQVPAMRTKTVTFALPGTDTAKPVENTAQGALNDGSTVACNGTQGSMATCGGTRGRGGKGGKCQGQKKATGNMQNAPRGRNLHSRGAANTLVVNSLEQLDETVEDDIEYPSAPPMNFHDTTPRKLPTSLVDSSGHCGMGNYNNGSVKMSHDHHLRPIHKTCIGRALLTNTYFTISTELCQRQRRVSTKSAPTVKAFSMLEDLFHTKGPALRRYSNVSKMPSAELNTENNSDVRSYMSSALPPRLNLSLAMPSPSGATTSQECWEQAQPQPNGILEDFDTMEDVQPSLPEIASSSGSEPRVEYIHTKYHPHSNRPPRLDKVEEFQAQTKLKSGINQGDIDALLTMMTKRGGQVPLFRNHRELIAMWKKAAHLRTTFESTMFTVPLKVDGSTSQQFYMEPHTGNIFWEIQTALPTGGKPICYIIYAHKTRLSSFGTVQGYPVIVRLGNLPSHICNGQGVGGVCIIGWLPIIKEEAKHKDKSYYTDFKRAIWHKAFESILLRIKGKSKFGAWVQVAGGMETTPCHLYLFPTIMILSANYEEQCMMALTRGCKAKFPCNVCLVPLKELSTEAQRIYEEAAKIRGATKCNASLKTFGLRFIKKYQNTFWEITHCDVHRALSFDRLHAFNNGLFADHLLKEIKGRILKLGPSFGQEADKLIPILASLIEEYEKAVCDKDKAMRWATINACRTPKETKTKNWNFPKAHSHQHLFDNIEAKGVTLNYNTKPNESMHGSFKDLYQRHTNFKNVDEQILRVDDWYNAMAYLQHQINHHDKIKKEFGDDQVAEGETRAEDKDKDEQVLVSGSANSDEDYTAAASLHGRRGKGGGKLTMAEVEAQAINNSDFCEF
ncbi:hypothetical protein IW261DRAFT_1418319 [Armillaria novae-zelandiae]|uniref:Uncharacterized protein n=1 Tax=Armillaria novae-zelandiae TaxID=153914 RepID=A0AA39PEM4_9AGAR|nr:hypothetical protein IW261DRAFT_1418319 [Armillaria novae-zelandiae]